MARPHATDPGVEVSGQVLAQSVRGLREHSDEAETRGLEILSRNGFPDPDPDAWYSLRDWLFALDEIGEQLGEEVLTELGRAVPAGVEWPPGVDSAREGFVTVNDAYHLNHRGGDIGAYEFTETADHRQTVVCTNPYPCAFDRGIIEGTLRAFGRGFNYTPMILVDETSDRCRADGGRRCEYRVRW